MPIPHDYYAPWSDEPHLHNRGEGRPYVEPSWQANAAGYQLPILSTIGRGPRGVGLSVANAQVNDAYFSFDLVSDETGEVVQHVGPIPTGEVEVNVLGDQVSFITNQVELDSQGDPVIRKVTKTVTLPSGEAGTRIFMVDDVGAVRYKAQDDIYHIPMSQISYYNSQNAHREDEIPEMRAGDMVMFVVYSDETNRLPEMAYGFFASLDGPDDVLVKAIEYLPTIKGAPGDAGPKGEDGKTPKIRRCLYAIDESFEDGLASGEVKFIDLTYRGDIITGSDAGLDPNYNWLEVDAALPPKTEDILGIVSTEVYINANATMPAITFSPYCGYDFPMGPWGLDLWSATQKKRADTISLGVFNPYAIPSNSEVEFPKAPIVSAYVVVVAIDTEDEPVEPTMRYYFDKAGTPGRQEHKFTLAVDGLARKIGDAEQSHLYSDDSTISPGWGRYTFNGIEYPVVETTVTGTEGDYTTVFEITAYNNVQAQSYMGVRMYYEVVPNSSTAPAGPESWT